MKTINTRRICGLGQCVVSYSVNGWFIKKLYVGELHLIDSREDMV